MPTRFDASIVLASLGTALKSVQAAALRRIGYSKSAAYKVVATAEKTGDISDQRQGNGSVPKIRGCALGGLVASFNNKTGRSLRVSAKRLHVCHKTVANSLRRAGVQCRPRKKAPSYKPGQKKQVQRTLGILYREHLLSNSRQPPTIVMDDETYIKESDAIKFGNSHYYAKDTAVTPDNVKFCGVTKFPMMVGLWYAASDCGISDWFVWQQGMAVNADIYKRHCIQRRLIPFIEENDLRDSSIFWPDKASSHYAGSVLRYLTSKQVNFVPKDANPTKVPQCRPIEQMHAEIKRRVFLNGFYPKDKDELQTRLHQVMKEFQADSGGFTQGFSAKVRKLVRTAYRDGVFSVQR